jgi:cobalt-zinc-cadmium resistance protein CzcA
MKAVYTTLFLAFACLPKHAIAEDPVKKLTLIDAVETALKNNIEYNNYNLAVEQSKVLKKTAYTFEKTQFFIGQDKNNVADNGYPLNIFGIEQSFNFPSVYINQNKLNKKSVSLAEKERDNQRLRLIKEVSLAYYNINYIANKEKYYSHLDSIYSNLKIEVEKNNKSGKTSALEVLNFRAAHQQILIAIDHLRYDAATATKKLMLLMNDNTPFTIPQMECVELMISNQPLRMNPGVQYKELVTQIHEDQLNIEKSLLLPDITLSIYNGTNRYTNSKNYLGYEIGFSIPILFSGQKAKIKSEKIAISISENDKEDLHRKLKFKREELMNEIKKLRESLNYFTSTGIKLSEEISVNAKEDYRAEKIDLFQYVQSIENAITIEIEYLDWLSKYNSVVLELNYLSL